MGFGIAPAQADRQARPQWEPGSAEERHTMPAARLLPVLRAHALALTLMEGLQAIAEQGGPVVVIRHVDATPIQILMGGRRFPLPLGACAAVHALLRGSPNALPSGSEEAPARAGSDAATAVRAAIVQARVSEQRGHVAEVAPDQRAAQEALSRAYGRR